MLVIVKSAVYISPMNSHHRIDMRSLELANAVISKVEPDPERGIEIARNVCSRWLERGGSSAVTEWWTILSRSWDEIKAILLDPTDYGQRLRQSNPFCGILTPTERWDLYRRFAARETART